MTVFQNEFFCFGSAFANQCFRRKTVRNRLHFFFSILAGFKVLVGFCAGCWMVLGGFQAGLGLFCVVLVLVLVVLLWLRLLFSKILVCFDGFWIVLGCFEGLVCGVVFVGFCLRGLFFGFGIVLGLVGFGLVNFVSMLQTKTSNYNKLYQSKPFKLRHEAHETVVPAKTWHLLSDHARTFVSIRQLFVVVALSVHTPKLLEQLVH